MSMIARSDVQGVLLSLGTRSKASHAKSALSAVLTQAVREGYLGDNPIRSGGFELPGDVGVDDVSDVDFESDPFTAIEGTADVWDARTVLRAMPLLEGVPLETCWLAMVGAGLRREEALALRWKDVRRIEVAGHDVTQIAVHRAKTYEDGVKRTKTRRSVRIVAVVEPFGARLWSLRGDADSPVCDVSVGNIGKRWRGLFAPVTSKHAKTQGRHRGKLVGLPYVPLSRMRATHETYMQQAGVLDSVNAAAHGHSERVSYSHYQRPDTVGAAIQAGGFLVAEGGLGGSDCIESRAQ
jgi:integrase